MIGKERCKERVLEIAKGEDFLGYIDKGASRLINSGGVNLSESEDNFILPKLILSVVLSNLSNDYRPFSETRKEKKAFNNLKCF